MKSKFCFRLSFLVFGLSFALILPVQAQENDELTCENPQVSYLINKTKATCEEILALHESGVGLGEIMKAAVLAEGLRDGTVSWESLLEAHQNDIGWGELSRAYGLAERFSESGLSGEELLALKQEGDRGWGPIMHAHALAAADLGVSFDEALALFDSGMGWGEIRAELGLPPGPPPWAGQGAGSGRNGPPPHANGGHRDTDPAVGKDGESVIPGSHATGADKSWPPGPPPWVGGPDKGEDEDGGRGNGNGRGRGNGHDEDE